MLNQSQYLIPEILRWGHVGKFLEKPGAHKKKNQGEPLSPILDLGVNPFLSRKTNKLNASLSSMSQTK